MEQAQIFPLVGNSDWDSCIKMAREDVVRKVARLGTQGTCSMSSIDLLVMQCCAKLCNKANKSCQNGTEHPAESGGQ